MTVSSEGRSKLLVRRAGGAACLLTGTSHVLGRKNLDRCLQSPKAAESNRCGSSHSRCAVMLQRRRRRRALQQRQLRSKPMMQLERGNPVD